LASERETITWAEVIAILVIGRLVEPSSELARGERWYRTTRSGGSRHVGAFPQWLLNQLPQLQRDTIAVGQYLPQADIVHDKFHIAKYLGEAVDKVRKKETRSLIKSQDDTLKGTKYLWLTNPKNSTQSQLALFSKLKDKGLKIGRAWSIKEMFSELWQYRYEKAARQFFKHWLWWATHASPNKSDIG
jgi:hypothetical protein